MVDLKLNVTSSENNKKEPIRKLKKKTELARLRADGSREKRWGVLNSTQHENFLKCTIGL